MDIPKWSGWPHVLETHQFDQERLEQFVSHEMAIEKALHDGTPIPRLSLPKPRLLLSLFYEASSRTNYTFWLAGRELGCEMPPIANPRDFSSAVKGESLEDAIVAFTCAVGMGQQRGADYLVLRHNEEGAAARVAKLLDQIRNGHKPIPVINAGDGTNQHPTQALVDFCTIYQHRRVDGHPLDDITIMFFGDLRYGRTVNSLLHLLGRFGQDHKIRTIFCTHRDLWPKEGMLDYLQRHNIQFDFMKDLREAAAEADVSYGTRIQKERMPSSEEYEAVKGTNCFKADYLSSLRPGAFIMHPLPINRTEPNTPPEIDDALTALAIQNDPRCVWFRQSHRGVPVRIALLDWIFAGIDAL